MGIPSPPFAPPIRISERISRRLGGDAGGVVDVDILRSADARRALRGRQVTGHALVLERLVARLRLRGRVGRTFTERRSPEVVAAAVIAAATWRAPMTKGAKQSKSIVRTGIKAPQQLV